MLMKNDFKRISIRTESSPLNLYEEYMDYPSRNKQLVPQERIEELLELSNKKFDNFIPEHYYYIARVATCWTDDDTEPEKLAKVFDDAIYNPGCLSSGAIMHPNLDGMSIDDLRFYFISALFMAEIVRNNHRIEIHLTEDMTELFFKTIYDYIGLEMDEYVHQRFIKTLKRMKFDPDNDIRIERYKPLTSFSIRRDVLSIELCLARFYR